MKHAREDYNQLSASELDERIPADEPVFLLRGSDMVAASTVRAWAEKHVLMAKKIHANNPDAIREAKELARSAERHATRMDEWPNKKLADAPEGSLDTVVEPDTLTS